MQALISGLISFAFVFIVTFITLGASPLWGGVIWSLPFNIAAVVAVFYMAKQPDYKAFKLLISGGFAMVALVAQMVVWGFIIKEKFLSDRQMRYWGGFGISMGVWALVNAVFVSAVYSLPAEQRLIF